MSAVHQATNVGSLFLARVSETPTLEALRWPTTSGEWASMTYQQLGERVQRWAGGLLALGLQPEQRVAIAASTRIEWIIADTAVMCAAGATTTVYPSTPTEDVAFILRDSETSIVFAENDAQLNKVLASRDELPNLTKVIVFDGDGRGGDDLVMTAADLEALGEHHLKAHPNAISDAVAAIRPESLATLIYTSGTTGKPKGVELTHSNWVYSGKAIDDLALLSSADIQYLWLPLSHSFGKCLLSAQYRIGFATAVDGRVDRIVQNLAVVKPTFMAAVPRIFEKVHAKVKAKQAGAGAKEKIFDWAFGVGLKATAYRREHGKMPGGLDAVQYQLADKLVFSKIREGFGGRIRYFVSGSAPLSREVGEWFDAAGLPILEGYGLTETSGFNFVNRGHNYRFGVVGEPAEGTEVRIADDGEILVRGGGNMRGYHGRPEETAAVLTPDGWLHTGDIGEFDRGSLKITDRKKDMIKTSGGKYVAPQAIEVAFKVVCPLASQIVVHGDGRNFCSALVTLEPEGVAAWGEANGMAGASYEAIVTSDAMHATIQEYVDRMNATLPRWETIKKFIILPRDLTIEDGDLTPSLKVRRKAVEAKYRDLLDSLYSV